MRGTRIPTAKRIINSVPPLNPADLSEANANNLMFIWDNMGTGEYLEDASVRTRHLYQLFAREQAVPNMTLEVLAGIAWFTQNSYVNFAGGNSPAFVAPVTNPRIDVLTIRSDGVLYVIQGTEAVSPTVPTIPSTDIPLAQVYNVVGETVIHDNDSQVVGQGYIQYDLRPFVQVAVGSSAMPKIGLVDRATLVTSSAVNVDVVNFTGAGRLLGIGTTAAANAIINIIIDGVDYGGANEVTTGAGLSEIIFSNTIAQAPMFAFAAGAPTYTRFAQGIFFKSSLRVKVRSSAGSVTATVIYEHE